MRSARSALSESWASVAACLAFFLFHSLNISREGLWLDELYTLHAIQLPLGELFQERLQAGHLPSYFVLLKAVCGVFGISETVARLPSLLMGTASVWFLLAICRQARLRPLMIVVIAAIFFFHPFIAASSLEARMYSAVVLLSMIVTLYVLRYFDLNRPRELYMAALFLCIGLAFHLSFLAFIPALLAFAFWRDSGDFLRPLTVMVAPALIGAVLAIIAYSHNSEVFAQSGRTVAESLQWVVGKPGALAFGKSDHYQYRFPKSAEIVFAATIIMSFFFALLFVSALLRCRKCTDALLPWSLWFCFCYPAFMVCLALGGFQKVGAIRYFAVAFPAILVVMAHGLFGMKDLCGRFTARTTAVEPGLSRLRRTPALASRAVMATSALILVSTSVLQQTWKGHGVRESIETLTRQAAVGDILIYDKPKALDPAFLVYPSPPITRLAIPDQGDATGVLTELTANSQEPGQRIWLLRYSAFSKFSSDRVLEVLEHDSNLRKVSDNRIGATRLLGFARLDPG